MNQETPLPIRRIFIGLVSKCPDACKVGKMAYHVEQANREEQTDRDLCYWINGKEEMIIAINQLTTRYLGQNIGLFNGIPANLSDGWAPEYKFRDLADEDFNSISKSLGSERKADIL